jgi:hypothetical protein
VFFHFSNKNKKKIEFLLFTLKIIYKYITTPVKTRTMNSNTNNSNTNNANTNNKKSGEYYKYYETEEYKQKYEEHKIRQEQSLIDMRLNSSMRTQTEALHRPTYKELEKQQFIVIVTAQLEMNDHDGYCSSDECEYTRKIVKEKIVVPQQYRTHPIGQIANTREYKWANHLQVPEVNVQGSGYCKFVKPEGGLGQHEYRYTIKKVEIVENKKYKSEVNVISGTNVIRATVSKRNKPNKNGYLVMASEGSYSDYENDPYGYSDTEEGAQEIANEAVCYGTKRINDYHYKGPFDHAEIINLDNMKKVGNHNLLPDEVVYYRQKSKPDRCYWDRILKKTVYYTKEELAIRLKELYDKMIEAKKCNSVPSKEIVEIKKTEEKQPEKPKIEASIVKSEKIYTSTRGTINTAYCPDYGDDAQGRQCRGW